MNITEVCTYIEKIEQWTNEQFMIYFDGTYKYPILTTLRTTHKGEYKLPTWHLSADDCKIIADKDLAKKLSQQKERIELLEQIYVSNAYPTNEEEKFFSCKESNPYISSFLEANIKPSGTIETPNTRHVHAFIQKHYPNIHITTIKLEKKIQITGDTEQLVNAQKRLQTLRTLSETGGITPTNEENKYLEELALYKKILSVPDFTL